MRFLSRHALIIVDEIGYLPVMASGGNLFFQLVNACYEKAAMILTSNRGFGEWGEIFGDPVANLYLHYTFDRWMTRQYPRLPFCRYADDALIHCRSLRQAQYVKAALAQRLKQCGLELHPDKTRIVYCKDLHRRQL